ncbi:uncharacterized protein PADG_04538 [Paracoccidioides brasiliensis Pb18]|uniref:Uncharacterized protein n=1 Tax=Paracoccidioides brasiliensis (strain Pb18) TaxID=502780 RepID=C1GC16_PARBD|nr:uncharacterized protein PADG_04538 [Paracoccidioides brasiliensis Pb18]EEH48459.1 hypothetical protein PADG_04538 [Paracoccidioides brasiliensis Pb18]
MTTPNNMASNPGCPPLYAAISRAPSTQRRSGTKRRHEETQEDEYAAPTPRSVRRRQVQNAIAGGNRPVIDLTCRGTTPQAQPPNPNKRKKVEKPPVVEKEERRLRMFRNHAPQSYLQKLDRARTQRMFVVSRTREGTEDVPTERVHIVGTTGNIYQVEIALEPSCTCPDAEKGNQCKHIIYVLCNVLKVTGYLAYQRAFLSSELRVIFANAPLNPQDDSSGENKSGKRKPVDGDCPICFMEFEPSTEEVVWCKAACGNNIHKSCFEKWAATQQGNGVRCVYCRSAWAVDTSLDQLLSQGTVNDEGYVNVARQIGLSGVRGMNTLLIIIRHITGLVDGTIHPTTTKTTITTTTTMTTKTIWACTIQRSATPSSGRIHTTTREENDG